MVDLWRRRKRERDLADRHVASPRPADPDIPSSLDLMRTFETPPPRERTLVWLACAELLRRWDAQRRAAAPVEIGERVLAGLGLAAAVILFYWLRNNLPHCPLRPIPRPWAACTRW